MMHMQIKDIAYFKKLYIYSETDGTYFESLTTKSLLKIVSAKNDLFWRHMRRGKTIDERGSTVNRDQISPI